MAKTQDFKRRIRSIQNTRQLTRAMKMVSAAKLRRAQDGIIRARPYANQMLEVLRSLAARANPEKHPLLQVHGDQRVEVMIITSDRGLCGSFNASICRTGIAYLQEQEGKDLQVLSVGRKGRDFFRRRSFQLGREWLDVLRTVDYPLAAEMARYMMDRYIREELDAVYLIYNEFKSMIQQRPVVEQLLPIKKVELDPAEAEDYIYEPDAQSLFEVLLPKHVEIQVYRALLESVAAEHAARMTAMEAATKNAGELIDKLTLQMNRVRQAAITTEIIEVVSGAEAQG
jgi:F-type H+-transporting ATPase subunit gamma